VLGGSGVGGISVMLPLFIIQDFGKKHFGLVWGIYLFAMELGVWIFTMVVFDHFYENFNKDRWGR
jgi:cyanate permease